MKTCTKCLEKKLIECFTTKSGNITARCKKCLADQQNEWLRKNKDRVNEERRNRKKIDPIYAERVKAEKSKEYEKNKDRYAKQFKEYRENHKDEIKVIRKRWKQKNKRKLCVHAMVKYRIDMGIIIKPTQCEKCGNEGKIEAHHENYDKPFDIQWLCITCHGKTRKKRGSL